MNITSHLIVANNITKGIFTKKTRYIVLFASIFPDFDRTTQPHRENNLLFRIYNSEKKFLMAKNDCSRAYHLGIMVHYICDYYCYAHNYNLDISHGIPHIKYEIELQKLLKSDKKIRISDNFHQENFMQYILDTKKSYELKKGDIYRDLKYTLSVCETTISEHIKYFDFKNNTDD